MTDAIPPNVLHPQALYDVSQERGDLLTWQIHEHPAEYPDGFVLVAFSAILKGPFPAAVWVADSLEEVRTFLPSGVENLGRSPNDEAEIVETWA